MQFCGGTHPRWSSRMPDSNPHHPHELHGSMCANASPTSAKFKKAPYGYACFLSGIPSIWSETHTLRWHIESHARIRRTKKTNRRAGTRRRGKRREMTEAVKRIVWDVLLAFTRPCSPTYFLSQSLLEKRLPSAERQAGE